MEVAIRNSAGKVSFAKVPINFTALLREDGKLEGQQYLQLWRQEISESNEVLEALQGLPSPDATRHIFERNRIFFVAPAKSQTGKDVSYFSMRSTNGVVILMEITFNGDGTGQACVKTQEPSLVPLLLHDVRRVLQS